MAGKPVALIALVTLAVAASAVGALAADPPASSGKQRIICRGGGERSLGSHIRVSQRCRTAEQWQQESEEKGRLPVSLRVVEGQNDGHQGSAPR
jgi:hypothetical protein